MASDGGGSMSLAGVMVQNSESTLRKLPKQPFQPIEISSKMKVAYCSFQKSGWFTKWKWLH